MTQILIVLTSHGTLSAKDGKPTGFHYEELATPYYKFVEAGYPVTIASIKGGTPPHDPNSLKSDKDLNAASVKEFLTDTGAKQKLANTIPIDSVNSHDFDGIFLVGGHGTMWDFPSSHQLSTILSEMHYDEKPIAAICHGVSGLIGANDNALGTPLVKNKRINCFTNEEEKIIGADSDVPFLLETSMRELGADFTCSPPFEAHVAQDGNVITGQNPASAEGVAMAVIRYIELTYKQVA